MGDVEIKGSARIDWMYPEIYGGEDSRDQLVVCLMHTRAADNLIIEFDSAENAWLVKMERTIEHEGYMEPTGEYDVVKIPAWNTTPPSPDQPESATPEPTEETHHGED